MQSGSCTFPTFFPVFLFDYHRKELFRRMRYLDIEATDEQLIQAAMVRWFRNEHLNRFSLLVVAACGTAGRT